MTDRCTWAPSPLNGNSRRDSLRREGADRGSSLDKVCETTEGGQGLPADDLDRLWRYTLNSLSLLLKPWGVAQSAERPAVNREVAGSTPAAPAIASCRPPASGTRETPSRRRAGRAVAPRRPGEIPLGASARSLTSSSPRIAAYPLQGHRSPRSVADRVADPLPELRPRDLRRRGVLHHVVDGDRTVAPEPRLEVLQRDARRCPALRPR